jgi:hypothetical protein
VAACVLASAGNAIAQPGAPEPPPPIAAPAPTFELRDDAGWALYHEVFEALTREDRKTARMLAARLVREMPGHPATAIVREHGIVVEARPLRPVDTVERAQRGARAELALFQTLHGMVVGGEVCVLIECDDAEAAIGLVLVGAAGGALAGLSRDDITSGQRALINSGTAWGMANAGLILIIAEPDDEKAIAGGLLLGQAAGIGIGVGLANAKPTAGQVALANSGGQWALVLTGLTLAAADVDLDNEEIGLTLLAAADGGILAGAYLGYRRPNVSRAQTLVIDAGGIAGAVGGGSLGVVLSGSVDDRTTPLVAAVGTVIGLATAAYLTRNWTTDSDAGSSVQTYVTPVTEGRGGIAGIGFRW